MFLVDKFKSFSKGKRIAAFFIFTVFLGLFGRFVYYNIIVPWPYRHELKACIEKADSLEGEERDIAQNICFRTHPHFN